MGFHCGSGVSPIARVTQLRLIRDRRLVVTMI